MEELPRDARVAQADRPSAPGGLRDLPSLAARNHGCASYCGAVRGPFIATRGSRPAVRCRRAGRLSLVPGRPSRGFRLLPRGYAPRSSVLLAWPALCDAAQLACSAARRKARSLDHRIDRTRTRGCDGRDSRFGRANAGARLEAAVCTSMALQRLVSECIPARRMATLWLAPADQSASTFETLEPTFEPPHVEAVNQMIWRHRGTR